MSDWNKLVRAKVKCCACEGSLKDSPHINGINLNKRATWKFPVWSNVLIKDQVPRAVALICDTCLEKKHKIKLAIEWTDKFTTIRYHLISELEDLAPITMPPAQYIRAEKWERRARRNEELKKKKEAMRGALLPARTRITRTVEVPLLPARTKTNIELDLNSGRYTVDNYECLDCGFTTKNVDLMSLHQYDHKRERKKTWFGKLREWFR
jgi:hypothetical protein